MRNYKAKIKKIHKNNIRERKLSKALSKSVMINLCPYCEFHYKLVSRGYETHKIDDMKIADTCKVQCIEGYKYLLTYTKHDYAAVSTIQMFQSMGGYTVPISCKNK